MKKLAYWAHQHPRPARGLLIICRIILAFLGTFYGLVFAAADHFPVWPLVFRALATYLSAVVFYPILSNRSNFYRRKLCDGLLVCSTTLFYICAGNWLAAPVDFQANAVPLSGQSSVLWSSLERPAGLTVTGSRHQMLKKVKKAARQAVREIRAGRKSLDAGTESGLMFLSVFLAVILGIITLCISCRLACNGQEGTALLAILLGALITALVVTAIWRAARHSVNSESSD